MGLLPDRWLRAVGMRQSGWARMQAKKMIDARMKRVANNEKERKFQKFQEKLDKLRGINNLENKTYLRLQLLKAEEYFGNFRRKQTIGGCWLVFMAVVLERRRRWAGEFYDEKGDTLELIRLYWLGQSTKENGEHVRKAVGDGDEKDEKDEKDGEKGSGAGSSSSTTGTGSSTSSAADNQIIGAGAEFGKRSQNATGGKVLIPKHHKGSKEWFELAQGHIQEAFRVGKQDRLNRRKLWADRYEKVLNEKRGHVEKLERKREVMKEEAQNPAQPSDTGNLAGNLASQAQPAATPTSATLSKQPEETAISNNDRSVDLASTTSVDEKNAQNNSESSIGTWGRVVNFVLWRSPESSQKVVTSETENKLPLSVAAQEQVADSTAATIEQEQAPAAAEEQVLNTQPPKPASESICEGDPDKLLPLLSQQIERLEAELQVEKTLLDEIRNVQGPPEVHYEDVYPPGYNSPEKLAYRVSSGIERLRTWSRVFFALDYNRQFMLSQDNLSVPLPANKRPKYASIKIEADEVDISSYFKKVDVKIRAVNEANLKGDQNNLGKMEARIGEIADREIEIEKERVLREQKLNINEDISQIMRTRRFQFISRIDRMLGVEWFTRGVYGHGERAFMGGEVVALKTAELEVAAKAAKESQNLSEKASEVSGKSDFAAITIPSTPTNRSVDTRPTYMYISGNFNSEFVGKQLLGEEFDGDYEDRGVLFYFNKPYMLKNDLKAWWNGSDGDEEVWVAEEGTVVGSLGGSRGEKKLGRSTWQIETAWTYKRGDPTPKTIVGDPRAHLDFRSNFLPDETSHTKPEAAYRRLKIVGAGALFFVVTLCVARYRGMQKLKEGLRFGRGTIKTDPKVLAFFNARGGTVLHADKCLLAGGKFGGGNAGGNASSVTSATSSATSTHNNSSLISRTLSQPNGGGHGGLISLFLSRFSNSYAENRESQHLLSLQNNDLAVESAQQPYIPCTSNKGRTGFHFPRAEDVICAAQEMLHQNFVLVPNNQLLEIQLTDRKMNTMDDLTLDLNFLLIGSRQNLRYHMTATRLTKEEEWKLLRVELVPDGETVDSMELGKALNDARTSESSGAAGGFGGQLAGAGAGGLIGSMNSGGAPATRTSGKWRMTG